MIPAVQVTAAILSSRATADVTGSQDSRSDRHAGLTNVEKPASATEDISALRSLVNSHSHIANRSVGVLISPFPLFVSLAIFCSLNARKPYQLRALLSLF